METYVEMSFISIFSLFFVSNHDFTIYIDFSRIAASNTATIIISCSFCYQN